jgi:zeta-carotene desaturase
LSREVVVIGGGLAGLAAAIRLLDRGCRPIVLESRRRLGGRASSFDDAQSGRTLDNCQHVLMGCCANLLDLYERIGVGDAIEWHEDVRWLRPDGGRDVMRPSRLPAPLHLAGSLRRMRLLDRAMKRQVRRAMWRMLRMSAAARLAAASRTFDALLDDWKQGPEVRRLFWEPIVVSACNLSLDRVSARHAVQVFREGFMAGRWQATMGVPTVPLVELYEPAARCIAEGGGEVRCGWSASGIALDGRRAIGVETNRQFVRGEAVCAAIPWERLEAIADDRLMAMDARLQGLEQLGHSPILGVHVVVDGPVMDEPHLVLPGRGVHWVFNKGVDASGAQHLHAVVSAADAWMDLGPDAIQQRVLDDLAAAFPDLPGRELLLCRAVKERRATFAATADAEQARPAAAPSPVGAMGGDIEGLYLAGDWCDSGWPATMEGAVRSGYLAAQAIAGGPGVAASPQPGWLFRLLSR